MLSAAVEDCPVLPAALVPVVDVSLAIITLVLVLALALALMLDVVSV